MQETESQQFLIRGKFSSKKMPSMRVEDMSSKEKWIFNLSVSSPKHFYYNEGHLNRTIAR